MPVKLSFAIEYTGWPAEKPSRLVNRTVKAALREQAEYWQKTLLPRHFTPTAARKYGYARRTAAYQRAKQKKHGHNRPLDWSGKMRGHVLHGAARVTATGKGLRVTIRGVPVVALSNKVRTHRAKDGRRVRTINPNYRAELTMMTGNEITRIAQRVSRAVATAVSKSKARKTVKIT